MSWWDNSHRVSIRFWEKENQEGNVSALARAYHGRDVLVMDEATSALDNETEKEIVAEIQRLKEDYDRHCPSADHSSTL